MGEDLRRANEGYKKLLEEAKKQKGSEKYITKQIETLLYLFYLAGFNEGSGMTQVLQ